MWLIPIWSGWSFQRNFSMNRFELRTDSIWFSIPKFRVKNFTSKLEYLLDNISAIGFTLQEHLCDIIFQWLSSRWYLSDQKSRDTIKIFIISCKLLNHRKRGIFRIDGIVKSFNPSITQWIRVQKLIQSNHTFFTLNFQRLSNLEKLASNFSHVATWLLQGKNEVKILKIDNSDTISQSYLNKYNYFVCLFRLIELFEIKKTVRI